MRLEKDFTDFEQTTKLSEIGLDRKYADFYGYTLGELLSYIPKTLKHKVAGDMNFVIEHNNDEWHVYYAYSFQCHYTCCNEFLIDCLHELIVKLNKDGRLYTNTERIHE